MKNIIVGVAAMLVGGSLAGCGSGDEQGPLKAQGMWVGTTSTAAEITAFFLEDGTYWLFRVDPSSLNSGGVIQGHVVANGETFRSTKGRDLGLDHEGVTPAQLSGSYVARETLDGAITDELGEAVTFESVYDSAFETPATLAAAAGSYLGASSAVPTLTVVDFTIADNGNIDGQATDVVNGVCSFGGFIQPRSDSNLYTLVLMFEGGSCAQGTSTIRGVAYLDPVSGMLRGGALDPAGTQGMYLTANRR